MATKKKKEPTVYERAASILGPVTPEVLSGAIVGPDYLSNVTGQNYNLMMQNQGAPYYARYETDSGHDPYGYRAYASNNYAGAPAEPAIDINTWLASNPEPTPPGGQPDGSQYRANQWNNYYAKKQAWDAKVADLQGQWRAWDNWQANRPVTPQEQILGGWQNSVANLLQPTDIVNQLIRDPNNQLMQQAGRQALPHAMSYLGGKDDTGARKYLAGTLDGQLESLPYEQLKAMMSQTTDPALKARLEQLMTIKSDPQAEAYMRDYLSRDMSNPYIQGVLSDSLDRMGDLFDRQIAGVRRNAVSIGGLGGTRQALAEQLVAEENNRAAKELTNQMMMDLYSENERNKFTALNNLLGEQESLRNFQGNILNQGLTEGQSLRNFQAQAAQQALGAEQDYRNWQANNAQALLTELGNRGRAATDMASNSYNAYNNMLTQGMQYDLNRQQLGLNNAHNAIQAGMIPADIMSQIGTGDRALNQQRLDNQIQNFYTNQSAPWEKLNQYSGVVTGMGGMGGTKTVSTPNQGNLGNVGALAGAAIGGLLAIPTGGLSMAASAAALGSTIGGVAGSSVGW